MCVHVRALISSQCQAEGINSKGSAGMSFNFGTLLACQWIECAREWGGSYSFNWGERTLKLFCHTSYLITP